MRTKIILTITLLIGLLSLVGLAFSLKNSNITKKVEETISLKSTPTPQVLPGSITPSQKLVLVTKVVDGDTIEIETGQRVRYIGINTPETVDPRRPVQCFGKEASSKNKELVGGKKVRLEKDISETDKYGRLLRYVYLEDGTFVNKYLVEQGFAQASSYPPDVAYQDVFTQAQRVAQERNLGLWGGCKASLVTPSNPDAGCNIKGNISSSGEKIYHSLGQKYYDSTVIDETKGEKWFCTNSEAEAAGFRPSKI